MTGATQKRIPAHSRLSANGNLVDRIADNMLTQGHIITNRQIPRLPDFATRLYNTTLSYLRAESTHQETTPGIEELTVLRSPAGKHQPRGIP